MSILKYFFVFISIIIGNNIAAMKQQEAVLHGIPLQVDPGFISRHLPKINIDHLPLEGVECWYVLSFDQIMCDFKFKGAKDKRRIILPSYFGSRPGVAEFRNFGFKNKIGSTLPPHEETIYWEDFGEFEPPINLN